MRLTYINVLKLLNAIVKTTTTERVPGGYSQDVVGVHPELGADVGGLVPPLARLLVQHLRHHLDTGGVRPGVIFPVASAGLCYVGLMEWTEDDWDPRHGAAVVSWSQY